MNITCTYIAPGIKVAFDLRGVEAIGEIIECKGRTAWIRSAGIRHARPVATLRIVG